MSAPIKDEFSKLKISRQRRYQLRHQKQGLCVLCAKPAVWAFYCDEHRTKASILIRERQRISLGLKERYYGAKSYGKEKALTDSRSQE